MVRYQAVSPCPLIARRPWNVPSRGAVLRLRGGHSVCRRREEGVVSARPHLLRCIGVGFASIFPRSRDNCRRLGTRHRVGVGSTEWTRGPTQVRRNRSESEVDSCRLSARPPPRLASSAMTFIGASLIAPVRRATTRERRLLSIYAAWRTSSDTILGLDRERAFKGDKGRAAPAAPHSSARFIRWCMGRRRQSHHDELTSTEECAAEGGRPFVRRQVDQSDPLAVSGHIYTDLDANVPERPSIQ